MTEMITDETTIQNNLILFPIQMKESLRGSSISFFTTVTNIAVATGTDANGCTVTGTSNPVTVNGTKIKSGIIDNFVIFVCVITW